MTLGPVRVMGAGVVVISHVEEVYTFCKATEILTS